MIQYKFVCFVALRPKSTAMGMVERPVHLTTLFPEQVNRYFVHVLSLVNDPSFSSRDNFGQN